MEYEDFRRELWAGKAAAYEAGFEKLCGHTVPDILDAAEVSAGTRLLDVGCGTGSLTEAAAARGAIVTGVDFELSMVERTRGRVPTAHVDHGSLPSLPYPTGAFDVVASNFVVNHVSSPRRALTELARLARPGGRVVVTIWPSPATPLQQLWDDVISSAGVELPTMPSLAAAEDFPRTADGLRDLLTGAGLVDVESRTLDWTHRVDAEAWWAGAARGVATIGYILERLDDAGVARMKSRYDELSARYVDADGLLTLPTRALLAVGTAR